MDRANGMFLRASSKIARAQRKVHALSLQVHKIHLPFIPDSAQILLDSFLIAH